MTATSPRPPATTPPRRRRPSRTTERAMRTCLHTASPGAEPDRPPDAPDPGRRRARAAAALVCLAVVGICAGAVALTGAPPGPAPVATAPAPAVPSGPAPPPPPPPDGDAWEAVPGPVPGARFTWPLHPAPPVRTPFRAPSHPYGPGHRGVDLAAVPGATVLAAGAGTVVFAGPVGGSGVLSVLHADGLRTTYQPVRPLVPVGRAVTAGEPVALLDAGHPGCPAPACLHWGARRGPGDYLDPLVLLRPPRVRLLPLPDPWPLPADPAGPAGPSARGQLLQPPAQPPDQPRVQLAHP